MAGESGARPSWFVGAAYNRTEDQTPRFLAEGIWENGYEDGKYGDLVRAMRPGDRIAIKSSYTRKRDLPFDNRGAIVARTTRERCVRRARAADGASRGRPEAGKPCAPWVALLSSTGK
jgi:hypothetical protein